MKKAMVKFNRVEDIVNFVKLAGESADDVTVRKGRNETDGKSIMGVFALGFEPVEIEFMEGNAQMEEYLSAYAL
ncbi:MAG: HPr family phosphocarrier protein [Bilifractor sp.]|nr:HPr family phosphocarrier protein [Lachnospiraceae bacterium]MDY2837274.1 HPr family phosphocarrier protein [Bilifractor sp.]